MPGGRWPLIVLWWGPQGATATLGVYVDSGSVYESPYNTGASHLLEYVAFKTTLNRTHVRLVREVDAIGANVLASASREQMAYNIDTSKVTVPEALELLADAVINPKFSSWEVAEQVGRGVGGGGGPGRVAGSAGRRYWPAGGAGRLAAVAGGCRNSSGAVEGLLRRPWGPAAAAAAAALLSGWQHAAAEGSRPQPAEAGCGAGASCGGCRQPPQLWMLLAHGCHAQCQRAAPAASVLCCCQAALLQERPARPPALPPLTLTRRKWEWGLRRRCRAAAALQPTCYCRPLRCC